MALRRRRLRIQPVLNVFSADAVRALDERAAELGVAPLLLMESAGRGAAEAIRAWDPELAAGRVLAVCGRGGNGGDALCAARWLGRWGADVRAAVLGEPSGPAADEAHAFAASFPGRLLRVGRESELAHVRRWLGETNLVLDGILGIGLSRKAEGLPRAAVVLVNEADRPVVALDLPSGLAADDGRALGPAVRAQLTLAMGCLKPCHLLPPAAELCGEVRVVDVAYPSAVWDEGNPLAHVLDLAYVATLLPPRPRFGHKGTFGRVLVVGGAVGMAGAAALAAEGALRAGAGLVHVFTPEPVFPIVAGLVPEALVHPGPAAEGTFSPDAAGEAVRRAQGMDLVVVGPGLGRGSGPTAILQALIQAKVPLVLDADALFALAQDPALLRKKHGEVVLTPHPGEFARLVGAEAAEIAPDKIRWAKDKARAWKGVLVLKGPPTAIADPKGQLFLSTTGNTALAHGGSGDVLAGLIAGLWASGASPMSAAAAGAYVHGLASELASAGASERAILPRDLLESLPWALASVEA